MITKNSTKPVVVAILFCKGAKTKNRLHGKIGTYEMPKKSIHEIDEKEDLDLVKKILQ